MKSSEPHLQLTWNIALSLRLPSSHEAISKTAKRLLIAAVALIGASVTLPLALYLLLGP